MVILLCCALNYHITAELQRLTISTGTKYSKQILHIDCRVNTKVNRDEPPIGGIVQPCTVEIKISDRVEGLPNAFEQVGGDRVRVCASRAIAQCRAPPARPNVNMHTETKRSSKACKNITEEACFRAKKYTQMARFTSDDLKYNSKMCRDSPL